MSLIQIYHIFRIITITLLQEGVVFIATNPQIIVKEGSRMVFRKAYINENRNYDTMTGVFRCPCYGVYLFSLHIVSERSGSEATFVIVQNNLYRLATVSSAGKNSAREAVSAHGLAIHFCRKGDEVAVEAKIPAEDLPVPLGRKDFESTFSGVLLYVGRSVLSPHQVGIIRL